MSRLEIGQIGVNLNVTGDETYLRDAAEAERLGYATIWLPGGQIDTLARITKVAAATRTIGVASGIISADVYPAEAVLKLYADLRVSAPGRFVVGMGGPQQRRSLSALHDYLGILDAGDPPVPAQRRILAALGPRKLQLARDRCAGAITLLVTPEYTSAARQILGEHATLVVSQMLVLDADPVRARRTARGPLHFLSGVRGYAANFTRMGYSDTDISVLSDRLVDDLVVWGDPAAITAQVRRHLDAGADQVVLAALNGDSQPDPIQVARRLAGELLS